MECTNCRQRSGIEFDKGFHCHIIEFNIDEQNHLIDKKVGKKLTTFQ